MVLSSTTFAFLSMLHHWLRATDGNGSTVTTALLDYRIAFDSVDDHLLKAKLFILGLKQANVNWITDFLRVGNKGSNLTTSAVPAG